MQQGKQQPQHQLADGPVFWNITHNLKPGELESDLMQKEGDQAVSDSDFTAYENHRLTVANAELRKERDELKQRIKRLEEILREIANEDYRGGRSVASEIAFRALKEVM